MNKKHFTIIASLLVVIAGVGVAMYFSAESGNDRSSHEYDTPEPSGETVSEDEAPDAVQDSLPAAKELKKNLTGEDYGETSVSIKQSGEVLVFYTSDAENGPELKDEMASIAKLYSEVAENKTGGLTVVSNGVKLMVSNDAAVAYDDGKLNDDAFEQTFYWSSVSQDEMGE